MTAKTMDNQTACLVLQADQAQLSGVLNFFSVLDVYQSGLDYVAASAQPIFDLAAVENSDSAGVALLLEWWRHASQLKKTIGFVHVPPSMRALIAVGDLSQILGVSI